MGGDQQCRVCAEVYDDEEGHDCPMTGGRWTIGKYGGQPTIWGDPDDCVTLESRADVSDLIALLERVRERLPP